MTKALSRVEECLTFPILHFSLYRIRCCVRFGVAAAWMGETFLRLCFSGTFCWRISALYVFSLFLFLTFFYLSVVLLLVLMCFSLSCPLYVVLLSLDAFLSVSCFFVSLLLCISTFFSSFLPEFVWRVLHFHFEYMNCPFYSVFWVFFPARDFPVVPRIQGKILYCHIAVTFLANGVVAVFIWFISVDGWMKRWVKSSIRLYVVRGWPRPSGYVSFVFASFCFGNFSPSSSVCACLFSSHICAPLSVVYALKFIGLFAFLEFVDLFGFPAVRVLYVSVCLSVCVVLVVFFDLWDLIGHFFC